MEKVKGYDELLYAVEKPLKKHKEWKLQFVGDGGEKSNLIMLAKKLEILNQVEFLGFRKDVETLYQEAAICVIISKYEGFPLVVLEAMKKGVPIIAWELPSLKEIDGGTKSISFVKIEINAICRNRLLHLWKIHSKEKNLEKKVKGEWSIIVWRI